MILLEFNPIVLISASLQFREIVNGLIFITCLNLSAMLGWYLWRARRLYGPGWNHKDGMATTCLLFWLFGVVSYRSGVAWFSIWQAGAGTPISGLAEDALSWSLVLSAAIVVAIALRATHFFSPKEWRHKTWTLSAAFAVAFVIFFSFFN